MSSHVKNALETFLNPRRNCRKKIAQENEKVADDFSLACKIN